MARKAILIMKLDIRISKPGILMNLNSIYQGFDMSCPVNIVIIKIGN